MAIQQTLQLGIVLAIAGQLGVVLAAAAVGELDTFFVPNDAEHYYVPRGHAARLDCDVQAAFWQHASMPPPAGDPPADRMVEARWLLNGAPLRSDGRWKLYKNGTLVVPKIGKRLSGGGGNAGAVSVEGVYQCLAEHQRHGAVLTKTINLRIAYLKDFLRQPDDEQAREGQSMIVPCSINSLPKAVVTWERNGVPLPQDKRYVPLPSGSLLIMNVHSSDEGSYRCKAVNTILNKSKKSQAGYLTIVNPSGDDDENSGIIQAPLDVQSNFTVVAGDDIALYCVTNSTRRSKIHWINGKDAVVSNESVLNLRNITRQQAGIYTCIVLGVEGTLRKQYQVNVLQAPIFNSTPNTTNASNRNQKFHLAKNIRLNCTATGWPTPTIKWFKNGHVFDVQSHVLATEFDWGLLISSPTASDSGVYQCLAYNEAGCAWSGVAVSFNLSANSPREPAEIKCLPYEEDNVCLQWRGEPNVQAYTIIAHKTGSGAGPFQDFLGNESFKLVENLQENTQYTFLVRTFTTLPSYQFANVTCNTGIHGKRNLTIAENTSTSVTLRWEPESSDYNPCNESTNYYRIQWRKPSSDGVNSIDIAGFEASVTGLTPGEMYEFRAISSNSSRMNTWIKYTMPILKDIGIPRSSDDNHIDIYPEMELATPTVPLQLDARGLTANSINISWSDDNHPGTTYTLCYMPQDTRKICEDDGKKIEGLMFGAKNVRLEKLRPRTEYEIRIQAHFGGKSSLFSHAFLFTTPSEVLVPSEIQVLEYIVLTRTSACVKWEPPSKTNGRISKYAIKYSANFSWHMEKWTTVNIYMPWNNDGCWDSDTDGIILSTVLHDLDPDLTYHVKVVAVNDAGAGNATETLTISTKYLFPSDEVTNEEANTSHIYYKQGVGVAIGIGIAVVVLFVCFVTFVIFKKLRQRMMVRRRFAPNDGPYATAMSRPKQNGQHCHNAHELQQLVETNGNGHLPNLPATILDSKGVDYPNGMYNNHNGFINGHSKNLRITENPQYYKKNGKREEIAALNGSREYEEDSNSNLQKISSITKSLCRKPTSQLNGNARLSDGNSTLNSTSTISVDDSMAPTRQPTLEPNG